MTVLRRAVALALVAVAGWAGGAGAGGESGEETGKWTVVTFLPKKTWIVGEGVWVQLRLENRTGGKLPEISLQGQWFLDGDESKPCRAWDLPVVDTAPDPPYPDPLSERTPPRKMVGPGTYEAGWMELTKTCWQRLQGEEGIGRHRACFRYFERPMTEATGRSCVEFEIVPAQGLDAQVLEAFGGDPLGLWPYRGKKRPGRNELLRRFPESTYAAYVVWKRWAKGAALGWKNEEARDVFLRYLEKDPADEYLTWNLPCREDGVPDASVITRFRMPEAARCRDAWLELVLESHPDIWFADEIRLRLALDRYRMGDKAACESMLEDLAEHGREDVAAKARELLSAMRAKGMLPARDGAGASAAGSAGGQRP